MDQSNIRPENNKTALPMSSLNNLAKVTVSQVLNSPPIIPNEAWAPTILHNFIIQAQQTMLAENQQKLAHVEDSLLKKSAENYRKQLETEVERLRSNSINAAHSLEIESLKSELTKARSDLQQANQVSKKVSYMLESLISTFSRFVTSKIEQQTHALVHLVNSLVEQHNKSQDQLLEKIIDDQKTVTEEVAKRFDFQTRAVEDIKQNLLNSVVETTKAVWEKNSVDTKKTSMIEPFSDRAFRRTPFQEENFQQGDTSRNMENALKQARIVESQFLQEKQELLLAIQKVESERDEARATLLSYNNQQPSIRFMSRSVGCGTQFLEPPSKIRRIN